MKLTCAQMDILISFYIEDELSNCLKAKVEEHLDKCSVCAAKYEIIKTMIDDMKESVSAGKKASEYNTSVHDANDAYQYRLFKTNLSAYMDNELTGDENLKMKKITINNKNARKDLEESYNIKKLMNDSFEKTKSESKYDYAKPVIGKLTADDDNLGFHPAINLLIAFTVSVLIVTTFVLISLSV